jgi:PAS domain S-box-containing protein
MRVSAAGSFGFYRLILALLLPWAAFFLQWIFWESTIKPYSWFLFFPAVFFSSWVGGLYGGVLSTIVSAALAKWFFITPKFSFALENPFNSFSIALFMLMGFLFAYTQERVAKANRKTNEALAVARESNERLRGANEQITRLYERTLELDRLKNQLFANVSHELRTPLTLILGPVSRRLSSGNLGPEERHELEVVERNARLLYRHVSDLLDLAKLEAGRMNMRYATLDLSRLARVAASHFEVLAQEKNIQYTVDARDSLMIQLDAEKIQRVLLNILSNAFKFTPDHGTVALSLELADGNAVLRVRDNGPGIPPDLRRAVFERFRQVEGGAQRRFGGTGLGLAIVKEFVDFHRGSVEAREAEGGGALFIVKLPLTAPPGAKIEPEPSVLDEVFDHQALDELTGRKNFPPVSADDISDRPFKILVVEDNPDMNSYIAEALAKRYHVLCAFDGQEGLRKALEFRPDLIMSDVMMPDMSGDQMVEELRRRRELNAVPIVMLTAKADDELRVKLLSHGVQDYINKPFSVEELMARVGGLLAEKKRNEDSLAESERKFRDLAEKSLVGIYLIQDGLFKYVNGRMAGIFGYTVEEMMDKMGARELALSEDWPMVEENLRRRISGELDSIHYEFRGITKDHNTIDVEVYGSKTEFRGYPAVIGTLLDISERKQAVKEIQQFNQQLEKRVHERTAQLEAANSELETFSYSVSHDLRSPLRALDGFSQALLEEYADRLDKRGLDYLRRLRVGSQHMAQLIDDILKLSRVARSEIKRVEVNLSNLGREIASALIKDEPGRDVEFVIASEIKADCDPHLLGIALENLFNNAFKFTGAKPKARIEFGTMEEKGPRVFFIRDDGAGFDMAYADKLFGAFQRLHGALEFPGTGVGLATVQRVIHKHGGKVWAEGAVGKGAAFFFTLPDGAA